MKYKKGLDQILGRKEALTNLVIGCKIMKFKNIEDRILGKRVALTNQAIKYQTMKTRDEKAPSINVQEIGGFFGIRYDLKEGNLGRG